MSTVSAEPLSFPLGHGSVTITIKDGRDVRIRHIVAEDAALLVDLYHHLSPETRRLRFMSARPEIPDELLWAEAMRLSQIDPLVEAALIGIVRDAEDEYAVGVARIIRDAEQPTTAEAAIVLRDDYQGEGLGSALFDLLLQVAMVRGLKQLSLVSLAENVGIHQLVRKSGLPFTSHTSYGETQMTISLSDDAPLASDHC